MPSVPGFTVNKILLREEQLPNFRMQQWEISNPLAGNYDVTKVKSVSFEHNSLSISLDSEGIRYFESSCHFV